MKILTKEQEDAHYATVLRYGTVGGIAGLAVGYAGVSLASRRWALIRNLTLPMKGFLVTSIGSAAAIHTAEKGSHDFDKLQQKEKTYYSGRQADLRHQEEAEMSTREKLMEWARREKYKIVGVTWLASMVGSWVLVSRNRHLTSTQKFAQARVYAQGITVGLLCSAAAIEIHDQRNSRPGVIDALKAKRQHDREHDKRSEEGADLWKDMVAAEEERLSHQKK